MRTHDDTPRSPSAPHMQPPPDIPNTLRKHWLAILGTAATAALVTCLVCVFLCPPTYRSEAGLLLVSADAADPLGTVKQLSPKLTQLLAARETKEDSILAFLGSRSLHRTLIEGHGLLPELYASALSRLRLRFLYGPEAKPGLGMALQEKRLEKLFSVEKTTGEPVIRLYWKSGSPETAARMLTHVIAALKRFLDHDFETDAKRERIFLETQVDSARAELEKWERRQPDERVTSSRIRREIAVAQGIFAELKARLAMARADEAREAVTFKVLDRPFVPAARFMPKTLPFTLLAFFAGGFAAAGACFFLEGFRQNNARRD